MEFSMPERPEISHKGTFGKVLNVSGSDYMSGAAYLSSIAALKIGCGYVVLCSSDKVINAAAAKSSAIVFAPYDKLEEQISEADVILLGCGLGQSDFAKKIFNTVINLRNNKPIIIDADGINILAKMSKPILLPNAILTPHPKEAARLLKIPVGDIIANQVECAKAISEKYNCVTVLKLHNTIVCSDNLKIYKNETGNSGLAKAGSGDVLSGIIAGLAAQKCDCFSAAKLGVYLHGLCADILKETLTEYSILPEDIINTIPNAIKHLYN